MKFYFSITFFLLTLSVFSQRDYEWEDKGETKFEFGVAVIQSFSSISEIDAHNNNLRMEDESIGNWAYGQLGIYPIVNIPFYKNLSFYTGLSYSRYHYDIRVDDFIVIESITSSFDLAHHKVKEFHVPLHLNWTYRFGESRTSFSFKGGITLTGYFEKITINSIRDHMHYLNQIQKGQSSIVARVEDNNVNKLIPSLSGTIAFRFKNKGGSNEEYGITGMFGLQNLTTTYFFNGSFTDSQSGLITEISSESSLTRKNNTLQLYIILYPRFLNFVKKKG